MQKQAYDNLGLPGLIGWFAKAFGPEVFLPVHTYAKTKWPPDEEEPKWKAKIPTPGGTIGRYEGENEHIGNINVLEAEVDEITDSSGRTAYTLVADTDGGRYRLDLKYRMEES